MEYPISPGVVYDIESYPNYTLFVFKSEKGKLFEVELHDDVPLKPDLFRLLRRVCRKSILVGWNNSNYDDLLLQGALQGFTASRLYEMTQAIIEQDLRPYDIRNQFNLNPQEFTSIDLLPLYKANAARGESLSLKMCAAYLRRKNIREIPVPPGTAVNAAQQETLRVYCREDVEVTEAIYGISGDELQLRKALSERYHMDLRSANNAGIAEKVILKLYEERTNKSRKEISLDVDYPDAVKLRRPAWAKSSHPEFGPLLDTLYDTEYPLEGFADSMRGLGVQFAGRRYQLSAGGMHSTDAPAFWESTPGRLLVDLDVASYYPGLITTNQWHPGHLTAVWGRILKDLMEERLAAKHSGDKITADVLKIVVNSAFGKSNSIYSPFYDPSLAYSITVGGQVGLLLLIQLLVEDERIEIVSANTDGVTVSLPAASRDHLDRCIANWQRATGLVLEEVHYRWVVRSSISDYLAYTDDGKVKAKGRYKVPFGTAPNPTYMSYRANEPAIVGKAILQHLVHNRMIEDVVDECDDIGDFLLLGKANAGYRVGEEEEARGKIARFYWSSSSDLPVLWYPKTVRGKDETQRAALPNSDRARLVEQLPDEMPLDVDRGRYKAMIRDKLESAAIPALIGRNRLAGELRRQGLVPFPKRTGKLSFKKEIETKIVQTQDFCIAGALATRTGPEAGVIVLDHDAGWMDQIDQEYWMWLASEPGMLVWHGLSEQETVESLVRRGRPFKMIYAFSEKWRFSVSRMQKRTGIEIAYSRTKTMTVEGLWTKEVFDKKGEPYRRWGRPTSLPESVKNYLLDTMTPGERHKSLAQDDFDDLEPVDYEIPGREGLEVWLRQCLGPHLPENLRFSSRKGGFVGYCPGPHHKSHNHDLLIGVRSQGPIVKCVHATCDWSEENAETIRRRLELGLDFGPPEVESEVSTSHPFLLSDCIETELARRVEASEIYQELRDNERIALKAGMRGGKTTALMRLFAKETLEDGLRTIYATHSHVALTDALTSLADVLGLPKSEDVVEWLKARDIYVMKSDSAGAAVSASELDKDVEIRGILTTHAYIVPKFGGYLYPIIQQLAEKGIDSMLIDEVDRFLSSNVMNIHLEGRVKPTSKRTENSFHAISVCGARSSSLTCDKCFHHRFLEEYEPAIGVFTIRPAKYLDPGFKLPESKNQVKFNIPDKELIMGSESIEAYKIPTHPNTLKKMDFLKKNETWKELNLRQDLIREIDTSEKANILIEYPIDSEGKRISIGEILESDGIKFPYSVCNVPILILQRGVTMEWIHRHVKSIRFVSGTIEEDQLNYLKEKTNCVYRDVPTSTPKINQVHVIVTDKDIKWKTRNSLLVGNMIAGRTIYVYPYKVVSHRAFEMMKPSQPLQMNFDRSIQAHRTWLESVNFDLVTHLHGPDMRGVDLSRYTSMFINCRARLPSEGYVPQEGLTIEAFEQKRQAHLQASVSQAAARHLAVHQTENAETSYRYIVLTNAELIDVEALVRDYVEPRANNVTVHYIDDGKKAVHHIQQTLMVLEYHQGEVPLGVELEGERMLRQHEREIRKLDKIRRYVHEERFNKLAYGDIAKRFHFYDGERASEWLKKQTQEYIDKYRMV